MSWNTPRTWVDLEVVPARTMREQIRDNLAALSIHLHSGAAGDGVAVASIDFSV